jgi:hypothetical protein
MRKSSDYESTCNMKFSRIILNYENPDIPMGESPGRVA